MSATLLALLGIGVVAVGSAATFFIASSVPQPVLQRAKDNGRFAGLDADDQNGGSGKRATDSYSDLGAQVVNAC
jgi:hypothetical protein